MQKDVELKEKRVADKLVKDGPHLQWSEWRMYSIYIGTNNYLCFQRKRGG